MEVEDNNQSLSSENHDVINIEEKSKHKKEKKSEINKICFSDLNSNFTILKILRGVTSNNCVLFDILCRNDKEGKEYECKVNNHKLKYIAPLLMAEFYEEHICNNN